MAKKKTINTFEGGIDQDTDKKLVKPNTLVSAENVNVTKTGNFGALSTLKGFSDLTGWITDTVDFRIYKFEVTGTITQGETLFLLDDGITPNQDIQASSDILDTKDLFIDLTNNINFVEKDNLILIKDNKYVYYFASSIIDLSDFNNDLSSTVSEVNTDPEDYSNLGTKEISINDNENIIFYFGKAGNTFYLFNVQYNINTLEIINNSLLFKDNINISKLNEANIITNLKEDKTLSIYLCDGIYPDKKIEFNVSVDFNDYANKNDYQNTLRNDLYSNIKDNFNQLVKTFLPKPIPHDVIADNAAGNLLPGQQLVFFYRLNRSDLFSNISIFSEALMIPNQNIYTASRQDLKLSQSGNKFRASFSIPNIDSDYDFVEGFIIHYNDEGDYKIFNVGKKILTDSNTVFEYNTDFETEVAEEEQVELTSLLNIKEQADISKSQTIIKNRLIKANVQDSSLETLVNYDSRAYRFNSNQEAKLINVSGVEEVTIDGTNPDYDIAATLDAINPYNNEHNDFSDWKANQQYKFKADGTTLGGEGPNISYTFKWKNLEQFNHMNVPVSGYNPPFEDLNWDFLNDEEKIITDLRVTTPSGKTTYPGAINPLNQQKGFQQGEVYRFFLICWKGDTPSLSKWIGDIKFPESTDISDAFQNQFEKHINTQNNSNNTQDFPIRLNGLFIDFDIDTTELKSFFSSISIGYIPRTDENKTVFGDIPSIGCYPLSTTKDSGYLNNSYFRTLNRSGRQLRLGYRADKLTSDYPLTDVANLEEPYQTYMNTIGDVIKTLPFDIIKNNFLPSSIYENEGVNNLYVKKIGNITNNFTSENKNAGSFTGVTGTDPTFTVSHADSVYTPLKITNTNSNVISDIKTIYFTPSTYHKIDDGNNVFGIMQWYDGTKDNEDLMIGNFNYIEVENDANADKDYFIAPGTYSQNPASPTTVLYDKSIILLDKEISSENNTFNYLSLRRKVPNQYGGNSYVERQNGQVLVNNNIKIDNANSVKISPVGDTYVNLLDSVLSFNESYYPVSSSPAYQPGASGSFEPKIKLGLVYPISSSYNFYAIGGKGNYSNNDAVRENWRDLIYDTSNPYPYKDEQEGSTFLNSNILYNYNPIFSNKMNVLGNNTILASSRKINNIGKDEWLEFKVNDAQYADSNYGEIEKVIAYKNNLYIFQNHGIAIIPVDMKAVNITDNVQTILGTGQVLEEPQYILRDVGIFDVGDALLLPNDIIFRDIKRKRLYTLETGEVSGIRNLLESLDVYKAHRDIIYDKEANLVYIPIYKNWEDAGGSLVPSEKYYMIYNNNIQRIVPSKALTINNHLEREYFTGFNNIIYNNMIPNLVSFIELAYSISNKAISTKVRDTNHKLAFSFIVNPEANIVKVFDNLFIDYEVNKYVNGKPEDVFNIKPESIQIENEYQDTGVITITNANFRRVDRKWKFVIPRSQTTSINSQKDTRIRGYWIKVTIKFPELEDKEVKINSVTTSYRTSNLR